MNKSGGIAGSPMKQGGMFEKSSVGGASPSRMGSPRKGRKTLGGLDSQGGT